MEELLNSYGLYFIFKKFINTYWKILHFKCNKLWLEIKIVFRNIKKIAKDAAKVLNFRLDMTVTSPLFCSTFVAYELVKITEQ